MQEERKKMNTVKRIAMIHVVHVWARSSQVRVRECAESKVERRKN